jgi:hypothetical protein
MISDKARAFHEAAHAVIAMVLGIPMEYTTIEYTTDEDERKIHGHTKYKDVSKEEEVVSFLNRIIAAFAPIYTVDRLGEEMAALGCISDVDKVKASLAKLSDKDRDEIMQVSDNEAKKEVGRNWSVIEAVAAELLAKMTLTGDQVREIINTKV